MVDSIQSNDSLPEVKTAAATSAKFRSKVVAIGLQTFAGLAMCLVAIRIVIISGDVQNLSLKKSSPDGSKRAKYDTLSAFGFFGRWNPSGTLTIESQAGQKISAFPLTFRQACAFANGGSTIEWSGSSSIVRFESRYHFKQDWQTSFEIEFDLTSREWKVKEQTFLDI